jgi:predicted TIM-barrel fold metal-dependent hydrolase
MLIDAHCHILPDSFPQRHSQLLAQDITYATLFPTPDSRVATAEDLVQAMNQAGADKAVATGMGWVGRELAVEVNDYIIQSLDRYPDRIIGFCAVNPAWGSTAVDEMERCALAGLRGVGELHPDTQGFDITDRSLMLPLMDAALELGLPVLVHASEPVGHLYPGKGYTTPDKLYRFIQNFPENIIICAHWGGGLPFYALMPEVPEALKNVYFDTAASPFLYRPEVFAAVAGLVGPSRILFGTDYPLIQHQRLLRQVKASGLGAEAQEAILGGNIARLLRL